jgi:hypothetical protein
MDQLGIAQYLTRVGLLLGDDPRRCSTAKKSWMEGRGLAGPAPLRGRQLRAEGPARALRGPDGALDGLLYPLVYETIVDDVLASQGGTPIAMLTQFMTDWYAETRKWVDARSRRPPPSRRKTRRCSKSGSPTGATVRLGADAGGQIALGAQRRRPHQRAGEPVQRPPGQGRRHPLRRKPDVQGIHRLQTNDDTRSIIRPSSPTTPTPSPTSSRPWSRSTPRAQPPWSSALEHRRADRP